MPKRRRKKPHHNSQCQNCALKYCPEQTQVECAKLSFMALAEGTQYECPDYQQPYWERFCA